MVRAIFRTKTRQPQITDDVWAASGPRYRGSNPCLPAIPLSHATIYGERISISIPCLGLNISLSDFNLRACSLSSPVFLRARSRIAPPALISSPTIVNNASDNARHELRSVMRRDRFFEVPRLYLTMCYPIWLMIIRSNIRSPSHFRSMIIGLA
jgi:hypothetical protein